MPGPASRRELVERLVLDSICDDYENLSVSIKPDLDRYARDCGLEISEPEIVTALNSLVELGWAKAYRLGGKDAVEFDRMPTIDEMRDPDGAWFYVTGVGLKVELADYEGWPFDDEGALRKDWAPPVE